jgi:hypothetical protein
MTHVRAAHRPQQSVIAAVIRAAAWMLGLAMGGCATPPPSEPPVVPAPAAPVAATAPEPTCPSCDEQNREIARLRQDLAGREAELRELRTNQREQVKVIQESTREATRAKVKLRRLATQADAASDIAEVEVALASLRKAPGAAASGPLLDLAQALIVSTAAPFAQGDYGIAMERAAQAEQLIAAAADLRGESNSRLRPSREVLLQVSIPLSVTGEGHLRRHPLRSAPITAVLRKNSPVIARAYRANWLRVEAEDGRSGWVDPAQLGAR